MKRIKFYWTCTRCDSEKDKLYIGRYIPDLINHAYICKKYNYVHVFESDLLSWNGKWITKSIQNWNKFINQA